jgi:thiol-disulfide isomerase/thioredoxin
MKKLILPLVVVLVFGISIYTVTNYNKNKPKDFGITTKENSKANTVAPNVGPTSEKKPADKLAAFNFKLKDVNGKEVSLSDFKGKKVFLNFWATWCNPCKAEMPDIEKLYQETKDSDLVILAINLGDNKDIVESFIDDNKYNFTILLDLDQNVGMKYNIAAIPTSFFIDKEGNIISTKAGSMTLEEMKNYISKL